MGTMIHAKKTEDRGFLYRLWSTTVDSYYTPEMTLEQMVRWVVEYGLKRHLDDVGMRLVDRFKRANENGTSAHDSRRSPNDDWDEVREGAEEEPELRVDDGEQYIAGTTEMLLWADPWRKVPVTVAGKHVKVTYTVELVDPED